MNINNTKGKEYIDKIILLNINTPDNFKYSFSTKSETKILKITLKLSGRI